MPKENGDRAEEIMGMDEVWKNEVWQVIGIREGTREIQVIKLPGTDLSQVSTIPCGWETIFERLEVGDLIITRSKCERDKG